MREREVEERTRFLDLKKCKSDRMLVRGVGRETGSSGVKRGLRLYLVSELTKTKYNQSGER